MKIALFFDKAREDTIGIYFERALRNKGITFEHFWTSDVKDVQSIYDLYLRIDHGDYKYDIPKELHPSAFYVVDCHLLHSFSQIQRQAKGYDFLFCAQKDAERMLRQKKVNAFWVPTACDPKIHEKKDLPKIYDIGFVGTDGGVPRKFYLQEIRERYPDSFIGCADYRKMSEIYSQARIGFHYIYAGSKNKDHISMRVFEIMSCGTMLLANNINNESLRELGFQDRKNLVIYHNPREMFSLIDYYLKNAEEREKIAEEGYRLVTNQHTYENRLERMLKIIGLEQL